MPAMFGAYGRMLLRRLEYLGITDRLSEESRRELKSLGAQIRGLESMLSEADSQASAARLWSAYYRELERYGKLVKGTAQQARMRSSFLRGEALRTRNASHALARDFLRVVEEPEPINASMLGKMVGAKLEAAG